MASQPINEGGQSPGAPKLQGAPQVLLVNIPPTPEQLATQSGNMLQNRMPQLRTEGLCRGQANIFEVSLLEVEIGPTCVTIFILIG